MFFKGALLKDPESVLEEQGPNSRSARRVRFTSVEDVARLAGAVKAYVGEVIEVEEAGLDVGPAPEIVIVEDTAFKAAFEALTPGRQRVQPVLLRCQAGQDAYRTSREVRREDPGQQGLPRPMIPGPSLQAAGHRIDRSRTRHHARHTLGQTRAPTASPNITTVTPSRSRGATTSSPSDTALATQNDTPHGPKPC